MARQEIIGIMTTVPDSPFIDLIIIVTGILLLIYRDAIGSMTGYFARGHYIDKPTPGCLLIPFALLLIIGGAVLLIKYLSAG